jgi:hypothetical protein
MGREKNKTNKKGCGCHRRERKVNRVSSIDQPNMERSRSRSRSYVPQDLLEAILVRLPVKPIIRFKCVNKSWFTLLQNPTFITKHHSFQSQNNPNLLVQGYQRKHSDFGLTTSWTALCQPLIHSDDEYRGVSPDMQFLTESLNHRGNIYVIASMAYFAWAMIPMPALSYGIRQSENIRSFPNLLVVVFLTLTIIIPFVYLVMITVKD